VNEPVENLYFNWLCHKVFNVRSTDRALTYWNLFRLLHGTEFAWVLPMDENRAEDGKDLRTEFANLANLSAPLGWMEDPCSVLEMLIAFSRRAEHMTSKPYQNWFWQMLRNLRLDDKSDSSDFEPTDVERILDLFLNRRYQPNGKGGLFPLPADTGIMQDQRAIDIWYQFCDYVARLP
jgi:hypothetical protein